MAQPPEATAGEAQPHVGPDSSPLNLQNTSNDLEEGAQPSAGPVLQQNDIPQDTSNILGGGAQPVVAPHLQPVNLQHTSNILGGDEPFVGPNSQPINLQDTSNIQEGGAQPFVSVNLQVSNLQDTNNIIQGGGEQPTAGLYLQPTNLQDTSNIQGGSDPPFMTTAASATQAPEDIMSENDTMSQQAESGDIQPNISPSLQPNQNDVPSSSSEGQQFSEAQIAAEEFWREGRHYYYQPLYDAAKRGDWESANNFIGNDPNALTARITVLARTVLHVAALSCQWGFIPKLLELLSSPESIAVQDEAGNTVLHYVALGGSLKTAEALVKMNPALPQLANNLGDLPLLYSSLGESKKMLWYLSSITRVESPDFPFFTPSLPNILRNLIQSGHYDIALYFVQTYPNLALANDEFGASLLFYLERSPSNFFSTSNLGFFERCIYKFVRTEGSPALVTSPQQGSSTAQVVQTEGFPALVTSMQQGNFLTRVFSQFERLLWKAIVQLAPSIKKVQNAKFTHECAVKLVHHVCKQLSSKSLQQIVGFLQNPKPEIWHSTIANGIEEIVKTFLNEFPDLIYIEVKRSPRRNILQTAVEYRQEKIVNIIKKTSVTTTKLLCGQVLESGQTTLHLAGQSAPDFKLFSVSGAALQMQRELQWFKEVEKMCNSFLKEYKNSNNQTPKDVFRKEHEQLVAQGEKWMKDTANSCMLVTTLIATVLFAAIFTVPGGNVEKKGFPIFLPTNAFAIFAISNALGLFSSLTSLLMFLAILTARYTIDDFFESLPKKLIIGLGSLFFAIVSMIIAFGAALTIVLSERWQWVSLPITILASLPVAMFVMLQLPLFIQMVRSTYRSGMFHPWSSRS